MNRSDMIAHLRTADAVAREAARFGHHPFGAILVGPEGEVLMRQGNLDTVRHAESELARRAFDTYGPDFLGRCTMVASFEPCAMCSGTLYWANIGRLVYGVDEATLLSLTGSHAGNPTMQLSCREVIGAGQKAVEIHGPFPELADELVAPHRDFWK